MLTVISVNLDNENMMNPTMIIKLKNYKERFIQNHPKFPMFLSAVYNQAMEEGTVIEITATRPDGQKISSNIKLKQSDIEMLRDIQNLK